jgi:hypothetical protein
MSSLRWQRQGTWSIDGLNTTGLASDENTGIDDAHPLATFAEYDRRTHGTRLQAGSSHIVRLLSNMAASDGASLDIDGVGTPTTAAATPYPVNGYLTIVGVPAVTYSGTISASANVPAGGNSNTDNHFTDAGSPPAFATTAAIWKRTNGLVAYAWPQKDLTGGVFRTSCLVGGLARRTWADGDNYSILTLPTIHDLKFPRTSNPIRTLVSLVNESTSIAGSVFLPGDVTWAYCQFLHGGAPLLGCSSFVNCRDFLGRTINQAEVIPLQVVSGGLNSDANLLLPSGVAYFMGMSTTYMSFQSVLLSLDYGATIAELSAMFYDLGASACVGLARSNCYVNVLSCGGMGNTGKIFSVTGTRSAVIYAQTPAAGMTTDALPFQVKAATSALGVPIVDATYLSMIQTT